MLVLLLDELNRRAGVSGRVFAVRGLQSLLLATRQVFEFIFFGLTFFVLHYKLRLLGLKGLNRQVCAIKLGIEFVFLQQEICLVTIGLNWLVAFCANSGHVSGTSLIYSSLSSVSRLRL